MKLLLFAGSLRKASLNKKLISYIGRLLSSEQIAEFTIVDLKTLSIPVYDGDIEEELGIPEGIVKFGQEISSADAIIISSPEYNGSIAGSLKNTIDWLSRLKPVPLEGKPVLLLGASPGYFGTIRALGVSKAPFENLGCFMYPQPFALPTADKAFAENGSLNEETTKRLINLLNVYVNFAKRITRSDSV